MTEQRKRFLDRWFETLDGTQSAIDAGYSPNTACVQASQMLAEPESIEYIKTLREEYAKRSGISKDKLLDELRKIAFSDVGELYNTDGGFHSIKQVDDDTRGAISGIKSKELINGAGISTGTMIEVKMHDKLRAIELAGRILGYFEKDNSQKQPIIQPEPMKIVIVPPNEDDE